MKRIYSIMFAAVAILAAASCQKEMTNEPETTGEPFSFTATIGDDTKTALANDGKNVTWTAGDEVIVFDNSGKEVVFSTDITEPQATATFSADAFEPNKTYGKIVAVYPERSGRTSTYDYETEEIFNLHIGGTQNAVAGSFDKQFAIAVGTAALSESPVFKFNNVHSLVKFTVKNDSKAFTSIKLSTTGSNFAGLGSYNVKTSTVNTPAADAGANTVTLNGSFEAGKTYYIAVFPTTGKLSLTIDGEVVKKTTADVEMVANKIYYMGEISAPIPAKTATVSMQANEVLKKQSTGSTSWLTTLNDGTANMDRNAAFDGTNVYIAKVGNGIDPAIYAIPLTDPENVSMVNMTGVSGGYFPISCIRTIPNGDDHILIGSSMGGVNIGEAINIYAWNNGIDSKPTVLCNTWTAAEKRRFGDQFTVCGNWTKGELWFRSQKSSTTAKYNIVDGVLQNPGSPDGWGNIASDQVYLGSVYRYSMTDNKLLVVPGDKAASLYNFSGVETPLKMTYNMIGGITPFSYGDKKFIAYIKLSGLNSVTAELIVIEDTDENLETALNDNLVVFKTNIHKDGNSCPAGNSGMSCNVVTVGTKTYLFGHAQNIGFAVYEITGLTEL